MFPHNRRPTILDEVPNAAMDRVLNDNQRMRTAGNKLAAAAIHVANEYDGCHRLLQAASEWLAVVAGEGGRNDTKLECRTYAGTDMRLDADGGK